MTPTTELLSLEGKHVVVFGGSTGIGLMTAQIAKQRKAEVTLVGRDRDKLNRAAGLVSGARIAVADIADRVAVEAVFAEIERVDHLVITAGG